MSKSLPPSVWETEVEPQPPVYGTKTIDGVDITMVVVDDGNLFAESAYKWYEQGNVNITLSKDGGIEVMLDPLGDSSGSYTHEYRVFDTNSNELLYARVGPCNYSGGCYYPANFNYDFSGSTKEISVGNLTGDDAASSGGTATFNDDRLLIVYGMNSAPSTWPEAVESDSNVSASVVSGIPNTACPGSTVNAEIELQNNKLIGEVSGSATITNNVSGKTKNLSYTIPEGGSTTINPEVTVPDGTVGSNIDVISVDV